MVDAEPECEVDCILCECETGSLRRFFVGFRRWDNSEAQWMSKAEWKNAPNLFAEWE